MVVQVETVYESIQHRHRLRSQFEAQGPFATTSFDLVAFPTGPTRDAVAHRVYIGADAEEDRITWP